MYSVLPSYEKIREWKDERIASYLLNPSLLNEFHDRVMCEVFDLAIGRLGMGHPPCEFTWFITGSGGRFELGPISDQDHGLVYQISNKENDLYFIELGKEISFGLNSVGYPFCQGNVMSSNPRWCKSLAGWKDQISSWMEEAAWETIRNLLIFYDARTLRGNDLFIYELKEDIYKYQKTNPFLLIRFMENIMHLKNGIGPFGQLVVEQSGPNAGSINLKYTAFLPYVNAIRLLAIKEGIYETSTIERINRLIRINGYDAVLREIKKQFMLLLKYRASLINSNSYDETHFLNVKQLSRVKRKEIKRILKDGKKLHQYVSGLIVQ